MRTGNPNISPYKGKRAWSINKSTLKIKLKDCATYLGVFLGVSLVAFSLLDLYTYYYLTITGVIISPLSLILREYEKKPKYTMVAVEGEEVVDEDEDDEPEPKPQYVKQFLYYAVSTLGVGLTLGGWITIDQGFKQFFTYTALGVFLSLVSRYNIKKHKILGIIEDYCMYVLIFSGVVFMSFGICIMTSNVALAIMLILFGSIITPYALILREKAIFKKTSKNSLRKFLSMVSVTIGMTCITVGVYSFLTGGQSFFLFLLPEGFLFLIGGSIFHDNKLLVSLKYLL